MRERKMVGWALSTLQLDLSVVQQNSTKVVIGWKHSHQMRKAFHGASFWWQMWWHGYSHSHSHCKYIVRKTPPDEWDQWFEYVCVWGSNAVIMLKQKQSSFLVFQKRSHHGFLYLNTEWQEYHFHFYQKKTINQSLSLNFVQTTFDMDFLGISEIEHI